MNIKELQIWVNDKIEERDLPILKIRPDGVWGPASRKAFLEVFRNKKAESITQEQLKNIAILLGDTNTNRIQAVAKVESSGSGWSNDGLVKILYERHYFFKFTKKIIEIAGLGFLSNSKYGGYTLDINKNSINDSWEKVSHAIAYNLDGALQSFSIGSFQVMTIYWEKLGYKSPLDMIYQCSLSEYEQYKCLANYILKVANLKKAFLSISSDPESCRAFAKGYNGALYYKGEYHIKIANAYKKVIT